VETGTTASRSARAVEPSSQIRTEYFIWLERCLERISQYDDFIRSPVETGGEVEFYVSAFLSGLCGFQFHSALLGRIAAAGIGLSVELYPKDD